MPRQRLWISGQRAACTFLVLCGLACVLTCLFWSHFVVIIGPRPLFHEVNLTDSPGWNNIRGVTDGRGTWAFFDYYRNVVVILVTRDPELVVRVGDASETRATFKHNRTDEDLVTVEPRPNSLVVLLLPEGQETFSLRSSVAESLREQLIPIYYHKNPPYPPLCDEILKRCPSSDQDRLRGYLQPHGLLSMD